MDSQFQATGAVSRRTGWRQGAGARGLGTRMAAADAREAEAAGDAAIRPRESLKITRLETFLVKPRWLFLKIHTDAGIVGLGEPILEGRARTCATAVEEIAPYQPFFIEEPVPCQNVDLLADIARSTHLPIATGERIFTKWGFREILEKRAASILQPDLCHAGGITEGRIIAGMAEAYYATIAPHNPLGPISLAAGIQLAAAIPNVLCQEQVSLGEGYLRQPFQVENGYIPLPATPGLGVELDEHALADKIDHDWRNRETYDPDDGSVVDW